MKRTVLLSKREQMDAVCEEGLADTAVIDSIMYRSYDELAECLSDDITGLRDAGLKVRFAMPYVFRDKTARQYDKLWDMFEAAQPDGIMARNYDTLGFLKERQYPSEKIYLDSFIYTFSDMAADEFKTQGYSHFTLPLELNKKELFHRDASMSELVIYGRSVLMISAGCINNTLNGCDNTPKLSYLTDRFDKSFPVLNICSDCYNLTLNSDILNLTDDHGLIERIEPVAVRYHFTIENADEVKSILQGNLPEKNGQKYTRGHINRGIE